MRKLLIFLFGIIINYSLPAHPWKPSHFVIIDTDAGIDDIRAISLLLASPDVRVLAISVSDGALPSDIGWIKVKSLLKSYHHEGIPVGINHLSEFKSPSYENALNAIWGNEAGLNPSNAPQSLKLIEDIITYEKTKISFLSLGGLTTAWQALNNTPLFKDQIKDFIWSADGSDDRKGFNYRIDTKAATGILKQEIPVKIINSRVTPWRDPTSTGNFYSPELLGSISLIKNVYSYKLTDFFKIAGASGHSFSYQATDEMIPLFLHYPDLFLNKVAYNVADCTPVDPELLREALLKILKGETISRNQVINVIPADPGFYMEDIRPAVTEIIEKYGMDEWSSGVLANELHRHLGVFAIIGVKMGIRAREYFNTGVDEFNAVSYAGSTPPLSCMNDGIQVSTGATPGHGLLIVKNDEPVKPSAEFTYLNHRIRLTLKPEYSGKLLSELKEINFIYGLDSNIYWELVRKNSIKYWQELDRHEIFDIEDLQ